MTQPEKNLPGRGSSVLAALADGATKEVQEQCAESWQALRQLLEANRTPLDESKLIRAVAQRMRRRRTQTRVRILAMAALLAVVLGSAWAIDSTTIPEQQIADRPAAVDHTPIVSESVGEPVVGEPTATTRRATRTSPTTDVSDGLDWDDHLTEELAFAQQQVWSIQTRPPSNEAEYLQQRMLLLENDLNNEAL